MLGAVYLRRRLPVLVFLLVLLLTPFCGELLVSLRRPIFYDRTLIWTTIPLYLLLAFGLLQLRFKTLDRMGGLSCCVRSTCCRCRITIRTSPKNSGGKLLPPSPARCTTAI